MLNGQEGLSLRSTKTSLLLLRSEPQEPSSRQRTIDWKEFDDDPRMVLYKHSNRPDHDCIYYLVFQQFSSDAIILYANMLASALDGCQFCKRSFVRKEPSRLQSSQRRLLANELTYAYQVNQKYDIHKTRKRKHHISSLTRQVSHYPNTSTMVADFNKNYAQKKDRTRRIRSCAT